MRKSRVKADVKPEIPRNLDGFRKVLAPFYIKWFQDCHDSIIYCLDRGQVERAQEYLDKTHIYLDIIMSNWDAIEFFSVGDRAFLYDGALPEQFRYYI